MNSMPTTGSQLGRTKHRARNRLAQKIRLRIVGSDIGGKSGKSGNLANGLQQVEDLDTLRKIQQAFFACDNIDVLRVLLN